MKASDFVLILIALMVGLFVIRYVIVEANDPLMLEALKKAKSEISKFEALFSKFSENAIFKIRFVSDAENVEFLWAQVLRKLEGDQYEIQYLTQPVTHKGTFEAFSRCHLNQVEDWQVTDANEKIHGGYTHRVLYAIAKRDGMPIPPELAEARSQFAEGY